jgi:hypothetical protein
MTFNVPSNSLNIGSIDILFHTDTVQSPDGAMTTDQWTALLDAIAALCPPPIGTKE